ncbi:hypothetical protein WJX79_010798 [Trebouxia sp. C0005]
MFADTADSQNKLPGKGGEPEPKAKACFAQERRQKRLAKNRGTAKRSRERKRAFLQQLQQRMYSLELEKSRMEQAIVQRDEQLMQMRGLPGAHPQENLDGVNKGLPPCQENGLDGTTMRIVLPDVSAPLKVHSKIAPPPSSNPGHAEDPNISTQKSSSQCSASHESLAIEGGPPDAKSAVTCSIDHDQHFADFLAVFFQDSQGLPSYAKGASRNLDPAILDPLETQQVVRDWNEAISTRSEHGENESLSPAQLLPSAVHQQDIKERFGTPGIGQDVSSVDVTWFSTAASWTSISSSTHIGNYLQETNHCLSEEEMSLCCSRPCGEESNCNNTQPPW